MGDPPGPHQTCEAEFLVLSALGNGRMFVGDDFHLEPGKEAAGSPEGIHPCLPRHCFGPSASLPSSPTFRTAGTRGETNSQT